MVTNRGEFATSIFDGFLYLFLSLVSNGWHVELFELDLSGQTLWQTVWFYPSIGRTDDIFVRSHF